MKLFSDRAVRWLKVPAFLACLGPVGLLTWKVFHEQLGANPVDVITRSTGKWTLTFLLITLGVTPRQPGNAAQWGHAQRNQEKSERPLADLHLAGQIF